jgi:hypothetical protein
MKLFLLAQDSNNDYDTYDSCIVAAETKEDAITISPDEYNAIGGGRYTSWAFNYDSISCEEIGVANDNVKRGVVLASFNAG